MKFHIVDSEPGKTAKASFIKPLVPNKPIYQTSHEWTWRDYLGAFLARTSAYRKDYRVEPGLYKIGNPDKDSDVLVSANYKLSFNHLRRNLKHRDLWILVLDTKGINVWCAAGKGTFGTHELIKKIKENNLPSIIAHRRIIVPQLGGPGINAHEVKKETGFRVYYGPVYAHDLPLYLDTNYQATEKMRKSRFNLLDRMVLIPMEIIPGLQYFLYYAAGIFLFMGLQKSGILFREAFYDGMPFFISGLASLVGGAILTPLLLPILPFRAFSVKGGIVGIIGALLLYFYSDIYNGQIFLTLFLTVFLPLMTSFIALQFTGSTTFTNPSGVKKEHLFALPAYIGGMILSFIFLIFHKARLLGFI